jgi:hypothetical protein
MLVRCYFYGLITFDKTNSVQKSSPKIQKKFREEDCTDKKENQIFLIYKEIVGSPGVNRTMAVEPA